MVLLVVIMNVELDELIGMMDVCDIGCDISCDDGCDEGCDISCDISCNDEYGNVGDC